MTEHLALRSDARLTPLRSSAAPAAIARRTVATRGVHAATLVGSILLIGGLLAQEFTWIHCHIMYRTIGSTPDAFYRGLPLLAPFLAAFAAIVFRHPRIKLPAGLLLLKGLFVLTTVASLLLATQHCLSFKYLAGDFLRFAAPWLTLFLSYQAFAVIRRAQGLDRLEQWYDKLAGVAYFDATITIAFGLAYYGSHISNYFFIFLVGWGLLRSSRPGATANLVLAIVLLATIASSKRTNFALAPLAIALAILVQSVRGGQILRLCLSIGGAAFVGLVIQASLASGSRGFDIYEIFESTFAKLHDVVIEGNHDRSYGLRMNEVHNVQAYFERNPRDILFGIGFGGEIPMLYETGNDTPAGNMHHVHKGYWLYLLRNGVVGLILLAVFVWTSTAGLLLAGSQRSLITASCAIYALTRIVASFGGNLMMEDLDLPIIVGLGFAFTDSAAVPRRPHHPPVARTTSSVRTATGDCDGLSGLRKRPPAAVKASIR